MSSELSRPSDIVKLGGQVYTDQETDKALESVPEQVKKDFKNHLFTAQFWKGIEDTHTPLELLKERQGAWDKDLNDYTTLEYFPEEYTIQELNRLFPGWWTEGMKYEYLPTLRTVIVSGDLCVEIPTLQSKQVVKRWAIGSSVIEFKKDSDTPEPSQPDDRFKASRTEWIKLAGKWYGIGLEIYHQRITSDMRSHFEDIVRPLGIYGEEFKKVAATFSKGMGFRNYLKELPTPEQVKRVIDSVFKIPEGTLNKDNKEIRKLIMTNFVLNNNASNDNRAKFEKFISNIEHLALQYENQHKETSNESS